MRKRKANWRAGGINRADKGEEKRVSYAPAR